MRKTILNFTGHNTTHISIIFNMQFVGRIRFNCYLDIFSNYSNNKEKADLYFLCLTNGLLYSHHRFICFFEKFEKILLVVVCSLCLLRKQSMRAHMSVIYACMCTFYKKTLETVYFVVCDSVQETIVASGS